MGKLLEIKEILLENEVFLGPCLRFAEEVGHSILEEIQTVRIAHAEELLRKGTLSVDAVGDFSGYSSTSEFRRAFKHRTGLSPMAYARAHRNSCSKK